MNNTNELKIMKNKQNLEYYMLDQVRFVEDTVRVKIRLTGEVLTMSKKEYESGDFESKIATEILALNSIKPIKEKEEIKEEKPKTKSKPRGKKATEKEEGAE